MRALRTDLAENGEGSAPSERDPASCSGTLRTSHSRAWPPAYVCGRYPSARCCHPPEQGCPVLPRCHLTASGTRRPDAAPAVSHAHLTHHEKNRRKPLTQRGIRSAGQRESRCPLVELRRSGVICCSPDSRREIYGYFAYAVVIAMTLAQVRDRQARGPASWTRRCDPRPGR